LTTETQVGVLLDAGAFANGDAINGYGQPAPASTPYSIILGISAAALPDNNDVYGLAFVSTAGKIVTLSNGGQLGPNTAPSLKVDHWTNSTTFSAEAYGQLAERAPMLKIENNGTTLSFWVSSDGYAWTQIYSESVTAFLADIKTVGFFYSPNNGGSGPTTHAEALIFYWYSGVEPAPTPPVPGGGTVTSVAMSMPSEFAVSGSPITSNGSFAVSLVNQTANTVWAGPSSGGAASPTFRTLVAADIPALPYGVGTVTSVGLTAPAIFSVGGSPITTSGNLSIGLTTQMANAVWAGPSSGGAASPTFRALTATDIPSLSSIYLPVASNAVSASKWATARTFTYTGDATGSSSVDGSANVSTSLTLATVNSNVGSFGSATQVPVITVNSKGLITAVSTANITAGVSSFNTRTGSVTLTSTDVTTALGFTPGTGNGTVTSVGMSVPGALLSVTGSAVTTSGTLAVSLVNQSANQIFAGPSSGSAAAPTFRTLVANDIPTIPNTQVSGLGTMSTQNASAVAITGGSISLAASSYYQLGGNNLIGLGGGADTNSLAIGPNTNPANTTGTYNIAIGSNSLKFNTTGTQNVGIGSNALVSNTTGSYNFALGVNTLADNTSGAQNLGVGTGALGNCVNGNYNVALGSASMGTVTTGSNNIGIGHAVDVPYGYSSGQINIGGLFFGTGATASGTSAAGLAGILTNAPTVELDVAGVNGGQIRTRPTTVASLRAASTAGAGARAFVTDATSTTFASVVAGGGSNGVPVYSDGTNWRIG
jgi:hypothetical protein